MGHYLPYLMESLWKIQRITHVNVSDTVLCLVTQLCSILCDPMDCSPPGFSVQGDSPGKNTRVGSHFLLQWIFPTQAWNPRLLRLLLWQADSSPAAQSVSLLLFALNSPEGQGSTAAAAQDSVPTEADGECPWQAPSWH